MDGWTDGRMSAPLTRTTYQVFRRRLGGNRPAPQGRMLLFRSAPEITNGRTGCCGTKVDATLFGTGSRHRREGGSGDCDDKIVIIASVFFLSPEHTSVRPHLGVKPPRPRPERAAFFRGKPPLRKIISGDTYRFFRPPRSPLPVARSHVTERDSYSRPCGGREDEAGAPLPRGTRFAAVRSFIIQLRGRNFFFGMKRKICATMHGAASACQPNKIFLQPLSAFTPLSPLSSI